MMFGWLRSRNSQGIPFRPENPQAKEVDKVEMEKARLGPAPESEFDEVKALIAAGQIDKAKEAAAKINFDNVFNVLSQRFHDFTPTERMIYAEARHIVLATPQAVVSLARAVDYVVANEIPGAFVECGVYRGGSVMAIIRTLLMQKRTDRDIFLLDTFEGMPKPDDRDVYYTGEVAEKTWNHLQRPGMEEGSQWVFASLDEVQTRIMSMGYPQERIHFVKGMVEDTVPNQAPERIALLRLDTDFYSSTRHELTHLYPRLSPGGVLIIDDYGAFSGAQLATDEYIAQERPGLLLGRVDEHVRMAVKPYR